MPTVKMVEEEEARGEVRAVFDDIKASRGIDFVPNFWKTIARHPPTLKRVWTTLKSVMEPGRLDPLTKEMLAVAVSATNACDYCVNSHIAAARKLGMDDEMLGELMAVVGMFNQTNKLVEGYQVEVDERILRAARGESGKRSGRKAARRPSRRMPKRKRRRE